MGPLRGNRMGLLQVDSERARSAEAPRRTPPAFALFLGLFVLGVGPLSEPLAGQVQEPNARETFLGFAVEAGSSGSRLAPGFCSRRNRNLESRRTVGADVRGGIVQDRLRVELRSGFARMRYGDRSVAIVCPGPILQPDGTFQEEVHPPGSGRDLWTTDLRVAAEVFEGSGLWASGGIGRMWTHRQTYAAGGLGKRWGERVRFAIDLEARLFHHSHQELTRMAETGEVVDRREVEEWHTGLGLRIGAEVPVGSAWLNR